MQSKETCLSHRQPLPRSNLDLDGALESLPPLVHTSVGLGTHNTTSPVTRGILVVRLEIAVVDSRDELGEVVLVLLAHLGESEDSGGLLVDNGTETGLTLDDDVWNTHLAAEGGQEDNELDRVDIIGNDNEGSLLGPAEVSVRIKESQDGAGTHSTSATQWFRPYLA